MDEEDPSRGVAVDSVATQLTDAKVDGHSSKDCVIVGPLTSDPPYCPVSSSTLNQESTEENENTFEIPRDCEIKGCEASKISSQNHASNFCEPSKIKAQYIETGSRKPSPENAKMNTENAENSLDSVASSLKSTELNKEKSSMPALSSENAKINNEKSSGNKNHNTENSGIFSSLETDTDKLRDCMESSCNSIDKDKSIELSESILLDQSNVIYSREDFDSEENDVNCDDRTVEDRWIDRTLEDQLLNVNKRLENVGECCGVNSDDNVTLNMFGSEVKTLENEEVKTLVSEVKAENEEKTLSEVKTLGIEEAKTLGNEVKRLETLENEVKRLETLENEVKTLESEAIKTLQTNTEVQISETLGNEVKMLENNELKTLEEVKTLGSEMKRSETLENEAKRSETLENEAKTLENELKTLGNKSIENRTISEIKASVNISRGNSEDRGSNSSSVGFQTRTNSQDSAGSGITSGPMSSSELERVGSSDDSSSEGTAKDEVMQRSSEREKEMTRGSASAFRGRAGNRGIESQDSGDFEMSMLDFSSTPPHNLMKMLSGLLDECDALKKEKARLEGEVSRLEADTSAQIYSAQIQALEKSVAQAEADACSWKESLKEAEQKHICEMVGVREDLTSRIERLTNQYQAANKDKESMVIKYATAEREVIQVRKQKEAIERKVRDLDKEREQLVSKNKMLISERARICQTLDTKVQRNNWFQREVDRLKEEVSSREVKIKWAQTKLKTEMDAHQECQGKLERALTKITRHEAELREVREKAEEYVRTTLDDQNSRANVLNMQLKEEKARVILERQVNEDRGSAFSRVNTELESLKAKYSALEEESGTLRSRNASLENEREESEKLFGSLRAEVTSARQEASQLSHQLANTSHIQQQLSRERESSTAANQEIEQLKAVQAELEIELDSCRTKEAELLAFTQKLSDKNVNIQSQFSALQSKYKLVEVERGEAIAELEETKQHLTRLKSELASLTQSYSSQASEMKREASERSEEASRLNTRVLDLESEIQVLNRKHANAIKDMSREMQKLRRRVEQQEECGNVECIGGMEGSGRSSQLTTPHDTLSQPSPASSNTSLNTLEYSQPSHNGNHPSHQDGVVEMVVPQQVLVERIVKLQRAAAKRAEKVEFLEEHVAQLVSELKKKSRIIHHYIMKEEAGALSSSASDLSKHSNAVIGKSKTKKEAEVVRHGGIMASVYGSTQRDSTMTLELSLEINAKLQAVLEDTLLKNITLKENLNTLGDEIAKISRQNQQLTHHK